MTTTTPSQLIVNEEKKILSEKTMAPGAAPTLAAPATSKFPSKPAPPTQAGNVDSSVQTSEGVASGIGLETARLHTCAVRSPCSNCCKKHEAASNAKVLILEKTPKARVDTIKLDISSLKFVRAFAD